MIDFIKDNKTFQSKYGFDSEPLTKEQLHFRMTLLYEEFQETWDAYTLRDAEEWVDGHVDMLVIIFGNLYLAGVDIEKAWKEVFNSNMKKSRGIKSTRPQSGGFDIIKGPDWTPPSHVNNHGKIKEIFNGK